MSFQAKVFLLLLSLSIFSYCVSAANPSNGFISMSLTEKDFDVTKPYGVSLNNSYNYKDGVHYLRLYKSERDHNIGSHWPFTEIFLKGHGYSHGTYQFEGYFYVVAGTSGARIIRIVNSNYVSVFSLSVRDGKLIYHGRKPLIDYVYDKWFRMNVIHNIDEKNVMVYINNDLKLEMAYPLRPTELKRVTPSNFYFTFGVYPTLLRSSDYMESRWTRIEFFKKKVLGDKVFR